MKPWRWKLHQMGSQEGKAMTKLVLYTDKEGFWRWRAVARNGEIIADSGQSYTRHSSVKRAALRNYPDALIMTDTTRR